MRTHSVTNNPLVLLDGLNHQGRISVRPISADDADLLVAFGEHLSAQSRYYRFLSPRGFLPGEVKRLTQIDPQQEFALIATASTRQGVVMIGVARYVLTTSAECEFAVVIADAWQKLGLGGALLERLEKDALARGLKVIRGTVLATNFAMRRLALRLGYHLTSYPGDATLVAASKYLVPPH